MYQQASPISQMLYTLGLTREDLSKRSDEMRHFLTAQASPTLRVVDRDIARRSSSSSDPRSSSRCSDSKSSYAHSESRSCSVSLREPSPPSPPSQPTTPVKKELAEISTSLKHYDSMEVVIERQRRQSKRGKKAKKEKEKERDSTAFSTLPPPTSPSPSIVSHASLNLDSFMHSRDDSRAASSDLPNSKDTEDTNVPVTPQRRVYYRDHTRSNSKMRLGKEREVHPTTETPITVRPNHDAMPQTLPPNDCRPVWSPFRVKGSAEASTSQNPVTPQKRCGPTSSRDLDVRNLPSSSPPLSSPLSSPSRPPVNLVSSPGPMGPPPKEDEYDRLPYKLPPGPYSPNKPDLSYAALVGQAILSSPEHRLTLQEIYDWITIVYPHYKRGETTWMNSIRHVLSTTVCFRKVPRDRSVGRTLWAIWDEDLECFKDGGFKKHLCKDIMKAAQLSSKSKGKARKRGEGEEDNTLDTRKSKKSKKSSTLSGGSTSQTSHHAPSPLSHPLFPPSRPTPHHQPYYESCILQPQPQLPADIIFPPLPPTAYTRFHTTSAGTPGRTSTRSASKESPTVTHIDFSSDLLLPSSSSPPPSLPVTSEVDLDDYIHMDQTVQKEKDNDGIEEQQGVSVSDGTSEADTTVSFDTRTDAGNETLFRGSTLGPVQFWGRTPAPMTITSRPTLDYRDDTKGKSQRNLKSAVVPTSPTMELRPDMASSTSADLRPQTPRRQTPPSSSVLTTPPNKSSLHISSLRTPLSHKGLHMSPSASLAHYKSNLDPPPVHHYNPDADDDGESEETNSTRTPRRGTTVLAPPVTPKRLLCSSADSPFRLQLTGTGTSPYRTPGSRSCFDPHDPSALLDEELERTAAIQDDSPVGIFGKGRGSLLYDSPGALGSPGKWFKWW